MGNGRRSEALSGNFPGLVTPRDSVGRSYMSAHREEAALTHKMLIAAVFAVVALVAPLGVATADGHGGGHHGGGGGGGWGGGHGWGGGGGWGGHHGWGGGRGWGRFGGGYGFYGVPEYTYVEPYSYSYFYPYEYSYYRPYRAAYYGYHRYYYPHRYVSHRRHYHRSAFCRCY
jgi:hypothetical protein